MFEDVIINAHRVGGPAGPGIYISWFKVPENLRGSGIGTAAYEQWETELPPDVDIVYLHAADSGEGPSDDFWLALGFDYVLTSDDMSALPIESQQYMMKGVGRPTPDPFFIEEDD